MHILNGAGLHHVDVALVRAVLTAKDDRAVTDFHVGVAERQQVQLEMLLQFSVRGKQLVKNEVAGVGTQTFVI